jgi:hypothetical protein
MTCFVKSLLISLGKEPIARPLYLFHLGGIIDRSNDLSQYGPF